jgi:uncharacterized protein (UPF0261 family)
MAKVTSSADRSKRAARSKAKVSGKTPSSRANRSAVSKAKVTTTKPTPSRAITNGGSATMKQIRAKAVQARRQAEGKPVRGGTKGRALTLPNSAKGQDPDQRGRPAHA